MTEDTYVKFYVAAFSFLGGLIVSHFYQKYRDVIRWRQLELFCISIGDKLFTKLDEQATSLNELAKVIRESNKPDLKLQPSLKTGLLALTREEAYSLIIRMKKDKVKIDKPQILFDFTTSIKRIDLIIEYLPVLHKTFNDEKKQVLSDFTNCIASIRDAIDSEFAQTLRMSDEQIKKDDLIHKISDIVTAFKPVANFADYRVTLDKFVTPLIELGRNNMEDTRIEKFWNKLLAATSFCTTIVNLETQYAYAFDQHALSIRESAATIMKCLDDLKNIKHKLWFLT